MILPRLPQHDELKTPDENAAQRFRQIFLLEHSGKYPQWHTEKFYPDGLPAGKLPQKIKNIAIRKTDILGKMPPVKSPPMENYLLEYGHPRINAPQSIGSRGELTVMHLMSNDFKRKKIHFILFFVVCTNPDQLGWGAYVFNFVPATSSERIEAKYNKVTHKFTLQVNRG